VIQGRLRAGHKNLFQEAPFLQYRHQLISKLLALSFQGNEVETLLHTHQDHKGSCNKGRSHNRPFEKAKKRKSVARQRIADVAYCLKAQRSDAFHPRSLAFSKVVGSWFLEIAIHNMNEYVLNLRHAVAQKKGRCIAENSRVVKQCKSQ
jgi:hypothetical protein